MTAHPRIKEIILFCAFLLFFGSGFLGQWSTQVCRNGWGIDCFVGWSSTVSCLILFVMLTLLALHQSDPRENIARFWERRIGKPTLIALGTIMPAQITWHMWRLTLTRYEREEHDFLMLLYGYLGIVSLIWTIVMVIVISCRLILHRRAVHSH